MIWESVYWKKDLIRFSNKIKLREKQTKWPDISNANAEKDIMISEFIASKLFESRKISQRLVNKNVKVIKFNSN